MGVRPAVLLLALAASSCTGTPQKHYDEARRLTGGEPARGIEAIGRYGCGSCHTIPGVGGANATVGPPLSGIAARSYLAGRLPNTPSNMAEWIRRPQHIEPGNVMPDMGVSENDARDITAYLYTLR